QEPILDHRLRGPVVADPLGKARVRPHDARDPEPRLRDPAALGRDVDPHDIVESCHVHTSKSGSPKTADSMKVSVSSVPSTVRKRTSSEARPSCSTPNTAVRF